MKVGLVVPGGVDRSGVVRSVPALLWLIERLARVHEVHVFALRQEESAQTYPLLGATVHTVGSPARRVRALQAIMRVHRSQPFDLLHALWAVPQGPVAALAGQLLHVPYILHLAGGELADLPEIAYGNARTLRGRAWLSSATRAAAVVTAPSAFIQRLAVRAGIDTVHWSFGVALDRWPAAPVHTTVHSPLRLLHVGSLNRVKDPFTLIKAIRLLRDRGIAVHVDMIGGDTLRGAVQKEADAAQFSFHGFVPHSELRPFYDRADLLVVSSRHEAGPVAALEAAVAGVPVVGTRVGVLADWDLHAALAVPVAEPAHLADAIETLVYDDGLRVQLAREAQRRALADNADSSALRLLELYERVASSYRRSPSLST